MFLLNELFSKSQHLRLFRFLKDNVKNRCIEMAPLYQHHTCGCLIHLLPKDPQSQLIGPFHKDLDGRTIKRFRKG